ncbi:MAG: hypothetical protein E6J31_13125 [Chloroflexi bacterium]|nr:MAG: hypothetical protein E6J31_13125 [Chloroflexota bacterium]TMC92062.1 MAG: hypothetical protein E6J22_10135 [Chloroflexota bacterium]TMD72436.1 MAG: hypothetical protein E6I97_17530 [Chloroflexota bacterium]
MSNEMEKYPKNMGLEALVAQCLREINAAVRGEAHSEQHWKELMCRATVQHDHAAREALLYHLRRLVRALMGSHPHKELACHLETETYYVTRACEQFWQAAAAQEAALDQLSRALAYLRASLNGVILDALRARARLDVIPSLDPVETEELGKKVHEGDQLYWKSIFKLLPSEREQRAAYLLFSCGLQPGDIVRLYPREFNSLQEIARVRHTIIERLLANDI